MGTLNLGLASEPLQFIPHQGSPQGCGTFVDFRKVKLDGTEQELVPGHPLTGNKHLLTSCPLRPLQKSHKAGFLTPILQMMQLKPLVGKWLSQSADEWRWGVRKGRERVGVGWLLKCLPPLWPTTPGGGTRGLVKEGRTKK